MNTSKFKIGTTIRQLLLNDENIHNAVGDNIFPLIAPEETTGSFIIYQRDEYSKEYTKQGIYEESCVMYITVVADTYDTSQKIAIDVNDLLENYTDNFRIRLTDSTEDYADSKFIQVLKFEID